mmetsp:Transcript_48406/g.89153  ORF Transcript_48406/g.89153 Transcript_48406/m.89153 type:complete len:239 (-) Transcript_48406:1237-1953(-)
MAFSQLSGNSERPKSSVQTRPGELELLATSSKKSSTAIQVSSQPSQRVVQVWPATTVLSEICESKYAHESAEDSIDPLAASLNSSGALENAFTHCVAVSFAVCAMVRKDCAHSLDTFKYPCIVSSPSLPCICAMCETWWDSMVSAKTHELEADAACDKARSELLERKPYDHAFIAGSICKATSWYATVQVALALVKLDDHVSLAMNNAEPNVWKHHAQVLEAEAANGAIVSTPKVSEP